MNQLKDEQVLLESNVNFEQNIIVDDFKKIKLNTNLGYKFFNFGVDMILSIILLIITLPLLIIAAIMIRIESAGPIFYSQNRLGKNNVEYKIYKLRTMYINSEVYGAQWATKNDVRITNVGRILRKTRIDELPQLINVLKREMSIIGPRPERAVFVNEFSKVNSLYLYRTIVRPGLTGWSQINGGYDLTPFEKLDGDMYYIENQGIKIDILILLRTIKVVITGDGSR